jgi:hypothetical protein
VTVTFSTVTITGSGTSRFTFSVARYASSGTYPITITGTSGGTSQSTTLNLTVQGRGGRFR